MGFFDKTKDKGKENSQDKEFVIVNFSEGKSNNGLATFGIALKDEYENVITKIYYANTFGMNLLEKDLDLLFDGGVTMEDIQIEEERNKLLGFGLKVRASVTWDVTQRGTFRNIKFSGPAWEPVKQKMKAKDEFDDVDDLDKFLELDR